MRSGQQHNNNVALAASPPPIFFYKNITKPFIKTQLFNLYASQQIFSTIKKGFTAKQARLPSCQTIIELYF
jgi:hypothetical protein